MAKVAEGIGAFLLAAMLGAVIWLISEAVLPERLIGSNLGYDLTHSFLFDSFGFPAAIILAGIVGFVVRRGFWLWGMAIALPVPVVEMIQTRSAVEQGVIELSASMGIITIAVTVSIELAVVCTANSALGAGLRLLSGRIFKRFGAARGEPEEDESLARRFSWVNWKDILRQRDHWFRDVSCWADI